MNLLDIPLLQETLVRKMHHSLFFQTMTQSSDFSEASSLGALKVLTLFSGKALISVCCQWASWCGGSLKRQNKGSKNSVFRRTACCKSIQADVRKDVNVLFGAFMLTAEAQGRGFAAYSA